MAFRPEDAGIFVQDGETAVRASDGTEFRVVLEFPESVSDLGGQSLPGQVIGKPSIKYVTAAVDLDAGDTITVGEDTYVIAFTQKIADGVHSLAELNASA